MNAQNDPTALSASILHRLVLDLRKGWTPFPVEVDQRMNDAADQILRLQTTGIAFALALAKHVSITQWEAVIGDVRKIQSDPQEWVSRGLEVPIHLQNVRAMARRGEARF